MPIQLYRSSVKAVLARLGIKPVWGTFLLVVVVCTSTVWGMVKYWDLLELALPLVAAFGCAAYSGVEFLFHVFLPQSILRTKEGRRRVRALALTFILPLVIAEFGLLVARENIAFYLRWKWLLVGIILLLGFVPYFFPIKVETVSDNRGQGK